MTEPAPPRRTIRLRLHAMLRDAAGTPSVEVEIPDRGSSARDVFDIAARTHPALADWSGVVAFAVGETLVTPASPLGDDVHDLDALPPVSGG